MTLPKHVVPGDTSGGRIELVVVNGRGHELAPEFWENPRLPAFFLEHGLGPKPTDGAN
jgi:hypothetical protein